MMTPRILSKLRIIPTVSENGLYGSEKSMGKFWAWNMDVVTAVTMVTVIVVKTTSEFVMTICPWKADRSVTRTNILIWPLAGVNGRGGHAGSLFVCRPWPVFRREVKNSRYWCMELDCLYPGALFCGPKTCHHFLAHPRGSLEDLDGGEGQWWICRKIWFYLFNFYSYQ